MTYKDEVKIERLAKTFDMNYKLTRLYSTYLERFPELITKEMVNELCHGGDIDEKYAIGAILCEAFALRDENDEDRAFIRKYIFPSIRILDAKKYTENPYYKNISLKDISEGAWQIKWETYPPYRAMICDDMMTFGDYSEIAPLGFFGESFTFPAVLEEGNEWMTLSPVDIDTCESAIDKAKGKVVTFGLGLGYYAYMVSEKENVDSITVVEKSTEVINLFKKYILPQFENKEKVKIVQKDAFLYMEEDMPKEKFDYAFVDTWRDAGDGTPMYRKAKKLEKLSHSTKFDYWIENFLISRNRAENFEALLQKYKKNKDEFSTYEDFINRLDEIN